MGKRLADLIEGNARRTFAGRERELELLSRIFGQDQPPIWFVEGVVGIGKSRLLAEFADRMRASGVNAIWVDCRMIEPTEDSLLAFLSQNRKLTEGSSAEVATSLADGNSRTLLIFDAYESFQLLDAWLRTEFLPLLPGSCRVMFGNRFQPGAGWLGAGGWHGLYRRIELGPLSEPDALTLLALRGVEPETARRINRVARGHPLALQLALEGTPATADEQRSRREALPATINRLALLYLDDIPDHETRQAVEAASVVRRVDRPLIQALMPDADGEEVFRRLENLPVVHARADGLALDEVVQGALAGRLLQTDSERYVQLRRLAWRHLRERHDRSNDLWSTTADLLFMLQNPSVRDGFFPTGVSSCQVAPSRETDWPEILAICQVHEGPEGEELLQRLWEAFRDGFGTVWDADGSIAGYTMAIDATQAPCPAGKADPVLRAWLHHLERDPLLPGQRSIFGRTWLTRESGEGPSPAQAAIWLDAKRLYMEARPRLRRMYICQRDFSDHEQALTHLGFVSLPEETRLIDGVPYHTSMLDFGPGSVDGWLADLVASELGIENGVRLDEGSRSVVVDGQRVPLTKLEFAVLGHLVDRAGHIVTRVDLLEGAWETTYDGGSNVVDVVVRGIRKKLGAESWRLETVRGAGYRFVAR
ncbi:MAG: winged helix-turn-helix domain-containing protein [Thermomicrobiales bacterium]